MTYQNRFVVGISLLLLVSFVAIWGNVEALLQNKRPGLGVSGPALYLRLLREGVLVLVLADALLICLNSATRVRISSWWPLYWFFVFAYVAFCALLSIARETPLISIITGLRTFQYAPLILISFLACKWYGDEPFRKFGRVVVFYVLAQSIIGFYEVFFLKMFLYGETVFGSRAWGTLANPNLFGCTMAGCALYLALLNNRRHLIWILLALFMTMLSGSRAAMLSGALALGLVVLRAFPVRDRVVFFVVSPFAALLAYLAATTETLSGRTHVGPSRWDVWFAALENIKTLPDLLFGWGVGLGANTLTTLFGPNQFRGQYGTDSVFMFLLGSYGIIGVVIYFLTLVCLLWKFRGNLDATILLIAILFFSIVFTIWESYPINMLLSVMLGWQLAKSAYSHRPVAGIAASRIPVSEKSHLRNA